MMRLRSCRMFWYLRVMLWCISIGYAQDTARKVLKKVPVEYPSLLRERRIGGAVRLKVFVKADGSVRDTEVVGGSEILAESAQRSVIQWKFSAGKSETTVEIVVHYDPDNKEGN